MSAQNFWLLAAATRSLRHFFPKTDGFVGIVTSARHQLQAHGVSFGFVIVQTIRRKVPWLVAVPFVINLVTNLIFTPIQFGMRNLPLAAVDILIVWATIIWMMVAVWRHYRWVAVAQVPYFIWVSLATVLQLSITAMNWERP